MRRKIGILLPLLLAVSGGLASCSNETFDNSTLVIGMECNYAPFNWTENSENEYTLPIENKSGKYADGYDIQIAKFLANDLHCPVKIVAIDWDSLIPDLQFQSINLVIAGMTDTAERRSSIAFTDEYYRSELVLVTKSEIANQYNATLNSDEFKTFIQNKVVVSQVSTVTNDMIKDVFVKEYGAIQAAAVSTFAVAATDVANGSAFAMTAELPVAKSIVKSNPNLGIVRIDQNILGDNLWQLGVSCGVHKKNTALQELVNESLAKISAETRLSWMDAAVERSGE